jgi:membrane protease YdiL (CAAX protease family)
LPPADWPAAPARWQYWVPAPHLPRAQAEQPLPVVWPDDQGRNRRQIVIETWFVMVGFLALPVMTAVVVFAQHVQGQAGISRFPVVVNNPVLNMILGILDYLPIAAMVPVALLLLSRTGQPPSSIGLGPFRVREDLAPGLGLAALAYALTFVATIPFLPLIKRGSSLVNPVPLGHAPGYYVIWGISASATTAVAEEVFVNGYLLTRLQQLGWSPRRALALSLVLRTSYHVYYGLTFLLTVPFGYVVTRSFQKNRRLNRAIAAHFLYDAVLFTIQILAT